MKAKLCFICQINYLHMDFRYRFTQYLLAICVKSQVVLSNNVLKWWIPYYTKSYSNRILKQRFLVGCFRCISYMCRKPTRFHKQHIQEGIFDVLKYAETVVEFLSNFYNSARTSASQRSSFLRMYYLFTPNMPDTCGKMMKMYVFE